MAILYVTQFKDLCKDAEGYKVSAGYWGQHQTDTVDYTSGEASLTLQPWCRFVRLHTDDECHFNIGIGMSAATTSDARMAEGQTEFSGVPVSDSTLVRVISA